MARLSCTAMLMLLTLVASQPSLAEQTEPSSEAMPAGIREALLLGDTKSAVVWLEAAAKIPNGTAAYELGKLYRLGNGVPKNKARAMELFRLAASVGNEAAAKALIGLQGLDKNSSSVVGAVAADQAAVSNADWFSQVNAGLKPPNAAGLENLDQKNEAGTPLVLFAVQQERIEWIRTLIRHGVNLAATDKLGNSVLHSAVRCEDASILGVLVDAHAPTELKNSEGATALHLATATGNKQAVKRLVRAGANINEKNDSGWSSVMIAERSDDSDLLRLFGKRLANASRSTVGKGKVNKKSLLHLVRQGNYSKTKRLLNRGVDPNAQDAGGDTALILAVSGQHKQIVKALIDRGAVVDQANARGATPLHVASHKKNAALIQLLLTAGAAVDLHDAGDSTSLHLAVKSGCLDCVKAFVDANANLEAVNRLGMTPLLLAAKAGQTSVVSLLLKANADADAMDHSNRTGLWWAVKNQHKPSANVFLEFNAANPWLAQADLTGITPLHLAAQQDERELVERLAVPHSINLRTERGSSPLMLAAYTGADSVVELLLELGVDVDAPNKVGDTPLMAAIEQRRASTALLLVRSGASLNQRNLSGLSARAMIARLNEPQWTAMLDESEGLLAVLFKSLSD